MPLNSPNYPPLNSITNTTRALINDAFAGVTNTPGEGQIFTDKMPNGTTNNPWTLNILNLAIKELYLDLKDSAHRGMIYDNYVLTNIPAVVTQDPTVQLALDFNGLTTYTGATPGSPNTGFTLPSALVMPMNLWERQTGTGNEFSPMKRAKNGLYGRNQYNGLMKPCHHAYQSLM